MYIYLILLGLSHSLGSTVPASLGKKGSGSVALEADCESASLHNVYLKEKAWS